MVRSVPIGVVVLDSGSNVGKFVVELTALVVISIVLELSRVVEDGLGKIVVNMVVLAFIVL